MRSILWHVQRGSEVVVREEHLLVKLKALLFPINSFFPLMPQRSNYQREKPAKHIPSSVYLSSFENVFSM